MYFSIILWSLEKSWAVYLKRIRSENDDTELDGAIYPPTFGSGVLDHLETKGGGLLPPTPLRPGRLAGAHSKPQPVLAKRFTPRPVWTNRVVEQLKSCPAMAWVYFSTILESLEKSWAV